MYNITKKNWYILQTFSGYESHIIEKIKEKIQLSNIQELFGEIIIPSEKIIEVKNGKKKNSECKFFPGYILIHMYMNETSWYLIKSIPKIIGFIGSGGSDTPLPIQKFEIQRIINKLREIGNIPRPKILFSPGEMIRVKNGPFADFHGIVEDVDYSKHRLKVSVSIFGRSTPVELNFIQVEKHT